MKIEANNIYHLYNRGNNKQDIFFNDDNYVYFLKGIRKRLLPVCEILNYTLMPNHFHFLIRPNLKATKVPKLSNHLKMNNFSIAIKNQLSSYTKAINNQEKRSGSLFQQRTKTKLVSSENLKDDYSGWCFIYIHNNATNAKMVSHPKDWKYSSYLDYAGLRNGTLCNMKLAHELLRINENKLLDFDGVMKEEVIKHIF